MGTYIPNVAYKTYLTTAYDPQYAKQIHEYKYV